MSPVTVQSVGPDDQPQVPPAGSEVTVYEVTAGTASLAAQRTCT